MMQDIHAFYDGNEVDGPPTSDGANENDEVCSRCGEGVVDPDVDDYLCEDCITAQREEDMQDPETGNIFQGQNSNDWFQYGKLVLTTSDENGDYELRQFMDRAQFWPEVLTVSDHGNSNIITARIMQAECVHEVDEENYTVLPDTRFDLGVEFPCKYASIGCPATVCAGLDVDDPAVMAILRPQTTEYGFDGWHTPDE